MQTLGVRLVPHIWEASQPATRPASQPTSQPACQPAGLPDGGHARSLLEQAAAAQGRPLDHRRPTLVPLGEAAEAVLPGGRADGGGASGSIIPAIVGSEMPRSRAARYDSLFTSSPCVEAG